MIASFHGLLGRRQSRLAAWALGFVLLAVAFQVGHFFEHILQVAVWIAGPRDAPYMTPVGMWLMHALGTGLFPDETPARQALLGFEMLHLVGNAIFAAGTVGLLWFLRSRATIAATAIEGFHLYEHISLTATAYLLDRSIGLSTLFGLPLDRLDAVALRVWWHFAFNAVPTALVLVALYSVRRAVARPA